MYDFKMNIVTCISFLKQTWKFIIFETRERELLQVLLRNLLEGYPQAHSYRRDKSRSVESLNM